jgi:hypothetical protein
MSHHTRGLPAFGRDRRKTEGQEDERERRSDEDEARQVHRGAPRPE